MDVQDYIDINGRNHFAEWQEKLSFQARAKVVTARAKLENGNLSNIKWFAGLGEYRIDWGPGLRLYLIQDGNNLIIMFCGGDKSSQKKDIKKAKQLIIEYKERKNAR